MRAPLLPSVTRRRVCGSAGVTKLMSAIQDPFLFDLMMPDCIRNDQEWVQIAESWTDDFTRERETTPWLNRALSVLWPFINDIAAQVRPPSQPRESTDEVRRRSGLRGSPVT